MDNKIKLLVITPNKSGVGYYRSINPHVFMDENYADEVEITISETMDLKDPNFGVGYDIIHFHSSTNVDANILLARIPALRKQGIKLVMDLDDYWVLPTYFPQYRAYNQQYKVHEKTIALLKNVDYVTTTTDIFAKEISRHNKNVFVIPNAVDPREKQFQKIETKSDRLRVGIICGSSHEKDVELLNGVVNQLKPDIDKLQFVICGFDLRGEIQYKDETSGEMKTRPVRPDETVWTRYEKILTDNYSIISHDYKQYLFAFNSTVEYPNVEAQAYRRCWTKPVSQYASHYNNIDVLLAPLVENKFDEVKSQLKVVEAGFFNKAIIAQDFGPYKIDLDSYIKKGGEINTNGNALLVESSKNHKMWAKHIKFLLNNPEARLEMANNLSDKITKEYSLETVTKTRLDLYKKISNK